MQPDEILEPRKLASGSYTLYETPSGGLHLTLQVEGEEEPRHFDIPKTMLKMMGGGPVLKLLGGNQ